MPRGIAVARTIRNTGLVSVARGIAVARGVISGFTPTDIADLIGWESDFGAFQERSGVTATTPAVANNDPVGTWKSKYGTTTYIIAATDANRPSTQTNQLNSLPVIRFNGTTHFLSVLYVELGTAYTIIAIVKSSATGTIFAQWASGATQPQINTYHITGGNRRFNHRDDALNEVSSGTFDKAASDGAFHISVFRRSGTAWLNRQDRSDGTATATVGTSTMNTAGIGAGRLAATKLNGDMVALYLIPSAISDANVLNMEAYCLTKYGL